MSDLPPEEEARIRQIAQSGRMIEAIKEYRLLTNAGLAESKAAVEALRFGTSAPVSAVSASSREQQILDLMARNQEIQAIKLYREWTNVGLKEAKDAVEAMARGEMGTIPVPEPSVVMDGASVDDQIRVLLAKRQKIEAIKVYRLATNLGLKEAKDYVEAIEEQMPAVSPPGLDFSSDDPFAEENSRTRRMLVLAFLAVVIVAALAYLFFRNGF
ncbi:MAG: ribosomal protein L7/L12 [Chloroflexi bacterium]|nr:ribosomal protein L7/L12 [Chloroflexota bacterium]